MQISTHPTCHLESCLGTKDLKQSLGEKHLFEIFICRSAAQTWLLPTLRDWDQPAWSNHSGRNDSVFMER